jgi:hypothetical protein
MGVFSYLAVHLLSRYMNLSIATIITIIGAALVYMFVLIVIGGIRKDDISMLPKGAKLAALLRLK